MIPKCREISFITRDNKRISVERASYPKRRLYVGYEDSMKPYDLSEPAHEDFDLEVALTIAKTELVPDCGSLGDGIGAQYDYADMLRSLIW